MLGNANQTIPRPSEEVTAENWLANNSVNVNFSDGMITFTFTDSNGILQEFKEPDTTSLESAVFLAIRALKRGSN